MKTYHISSEMHDFCRTFSKDLTKPRMGRLKELMHGIIRGKKAILSEIARQNRSKDKKKAIRQQVQQYSDMLSKLPLETMVKRKLVNFRSRVAPDTPLYFDLVDITKEYHKSMEGIGVTWDGSKGEPGEGYEIVDVSLGSDQECCTTLARRMYSTAEKVYESQAREIDKVLQTMLDAWGEIRGTLFFDAGGDNNNLINMLVDYESTFVVRMNGNRGKRDRIFFDEEKQPVKMMSLWSKPQGVTVWQSKKKRDDKRIVQLQWRKVFWKNKKKQLIPMCLVWCHRRGDPNPVVFLTSRCIENEVEATKVYHQYFQRGQEEAVFKCHKDKLGMELVQLRSFEKTKRFMLIYVLVDQLLYKLHQMATEMGSFVNCLLKVFLKGTQRTINKWAIIDWYDDCYADLEREFIHFRHRYPPGQATSQLPLFPRSLKIW